MAVYEPGRGLVIRHQGRGAWGLDAQPPTLWEISVCCVRWAADSSLAEAAPVDNGVGQRDQAPNEGDPFVQTLNNGSSKTEQFEIRIRPIESNIHVLIPT